MEINYDDEIILGLPINELINFIGLKDDSEESIINALLIQIDRLVNYVIKRLLDDSKHPVEKLSFIIHDSFGIFMNYILSEEYFTIRELLLSDVTTLLSKYLKNVNKEIEENYGKKSPLYNYYLFHDPFGEMMKIILEIKDVLFDTIYFDIDADYDFDTKEDPDSDILFIMQALVYISGCDSFTELGNRYKSTILNHFNKLYSMENKLKVREEIGDYRGLIKYKLEKHKLDIVELIVQGLIMSDTDFE